MIRKWSGCGSASATTLSRRAGVRIQRQMVPRHPVASQSPHRRQHKPGERVYSRRGMNDPEEVQQTGVDRKKVVVLDQRQRIARLQAIAASSTAAEKMRAQFAPILSALQNYVRAVREEAERRRPGPRLRAIDREEESGTTGRKRDDPPPD